jgi:tetratricopeptide (TPR) repeat protein/MinD-like ATPase involved in chromosome partitioning or flagellar assembly
MPMFITFYSYKGGVGRTLALANVATLLARDKVEPCRVLVWDFDLPAPGLQDVVKCKWAEKKIGFVDYLDFYLRNAEMDEIGKYIHRTEIPGVDVLPAGFMGQDYARRLEGIQWQDVYEEAQGFQFIANTKMQISQVQPAYDYVLIDSLTGYSDVGGICVNQLADVVVLIFRLNHQNIEGISKVYHAISANIKDKAITSEQDSVVPVISPAWPFAASESNEWFQRANNVFGARRIFTLSFEGSMMLGEKILTAANEKYAIEPPILRDYRLLTNHLRSLNLQDLRTLYKLAEKAQEQDQFSRAVELFGNLVERRPDVERYWRELTTSVQMAPTGGRKQILPVVHAIIRRGCEAQKPWAYVAKAWLAETVEQDWKGALENFGRAIALNPQNANLYFFRGLSQANHNQYVGAAADLSRALELNLQGSRLNIAYFQLGNSYRILRQLDKALLYISKAIEKQPNETSFLYWRAVTLYAAGTYADAAADLERAMRVAPANLSLQILGAHVAASLGRREDAQRILEAVRSQADLDQAFQLAIAEAYLVVSPSEAISLLESNTEIVKEHELVASFLKAFAAILLGSKELANENISFIEKSGSIPAKEGWEVTELMEFLKWGKASGRLTEPQHLALSKLLRDSGWSDQLGQPELPVKPA